MSAMDAGVSGMLAEQTRMNAVGNNIANASTIGFKSSDVLFADELYQILQPGTAPTDGSGGTNPSSVGQGVMVAGTNTDFGQGSLMATGRTTDVAIEGNGFLTVTDGTNLYYTRDGSLGLDASGNLVQLATGMRVVGLASSGSAAPAPSGGTTPPTVTPAGGTPAPPTVTPTNTLRIPLGQTSVAQATTQMALGGNLDSRVAAGTAYPVTATVYDSLGAAHSVTLTFTHSATAGQWDVTGSSPDGTVTVTPPAQMTFDANGAPSIQSLPLQIALTNANGANATVNVNLAAGNVTQLAQDGSAAVRSQDGMPPGTLIGINIQTDGTVMGVFSNGLKNNLGQIIAGSFANPGGLQAVGQNLFQSGPNSGVAAYGSPGSSGLGALRSGQLEQSNVNLAEEFSNMIVTQRAYQADSRVVTTADQMLQQLMAIGQ
jgi:flagellar hook protein FlgE